jgi:hypothetical protein
MGAKAMLVDTFDQLKTPDVMASEVMAGETTGRFTASAVDQFGAFATGEVTMLKPVLTVERADGCEEVRYRFEVGGEQRSDK